MAKIMTIKDTAKRHGHKASDFFYYLVNAPTRGLCGISTAAQAFDATVLQDSSMAAMSNVAKPVAVSMVAILPRPPERKTSHHHPILTRLLLRALPWRRPAA